MDGSLDRDLQAGSLIVQKYRIVRLLGRGGMGAVYEAEHVQLRKRVALKLMRAEFASNAEAIERFYREARVASATGHDGVVGIHDIGEDEAGHHFMVMDFLEGETLDDRLKASGRIDPSSAVRIMCSVLDALFAVHTKGVIHRDMKPENIFLARTELGEEKIKILDFGISREVKADEGSKKLTSTGAIIGTPFYLSPEQARGAGDVDARADVYACGVILYQLLSGNVPFDGTTIASILVAILTADVPPLSSVCAGLPGGLEEIVSRAMARDRDLRFSSAREIRLALQPYLGVSAASAFPLQPDAWGTSPPATADAPVQATMTASTTRASWTQTSPSVDMADRRSPRRTGLWIAAAGVALVTVAVVVVAAVLGFRGGHGSGSGMDADPQSRSDPASEASAAAAPSTVEQTGKSVQPVPTVSVTFFGLPTEAVVKVGDLVAGNPVTLVRGEQPVEIRVVCTGYRDTVLEVTPDADQTLKPVLVPAVPSKYAKKGNADKKADATGTATPATPAPQPTKPETTAAPAAAPAPAPASTPPPKKKFGLDLNYDGSKNRDSK